MDIGIDMNHAIITEGREKLSISGVRDVLAFDEETIQLDTVCGRMTVKGENLHIVSFHTESGDLSAEGRLHAVAYLSDNSRGGMFSKLFR
ncbi:MAG: sporulation protein YabP [Ruminococcaceae bacterium]|nr:sporulation protein YabP [Oscillospiraceae bacterium]